MACKWSQPLISGHELSLSFPSPLWWICPSSLPRSWALFNGLFQPRFARRKPLTNPFKDGSMDFMAPRALSPSFNKVKSKALSIRQWARGTPDAAVFNPTDATVHCMTAGASSQSPHLGTFHFVWQSRFTAAQMGMRCGHLGLDADRSVDRNAKRGKQRYLVLRRKLRTIHLIEVAITMWPCAFT